MRSEVTGRVLEVRYAEGDHGARRRGRSPARRPRHRAQVASKRAGDRRRSTPRSARQDEHIALVESTWRRDVSARAGRGAAGGGRRRSLAERTFAREQELVKTGASTAQLLDDSARARDQARSALDRAREVLARTEAEERSIAVARQQLRGAAASSASSPRRSSPSWRSRVASTASSRRPCRTRRADAVHLAGRAGAARHADRLGPRSDRQVRADLRAGRRRRPRARRAARRDRARQRARPARAGRGQLRRRQGQLHAREDRDAQRPARARCTAPRCASSKASSASSRAPRATCISVDGRTDAA